MGKVVTLEEALEVVRQLSPVDKVRLIERIVPDIERELMTARPSPRKSLWGLCADLGPAPSAEEIEEAAANGDLVCWQRSKATRQCWLTSPSIGM